ncbi:oil body-associated protein 2a [Anaeramoeba flamelloides]|uniref:Oil body-associated protein 2a n=1 Tax=Anaeramoeba flamelloides TaxID=1746091 RepID=A0ABQ8Y1K9_9EUKA|nr:oil body-associated protein 2a [Anaeramoeba flamelloides]
MKISYSSNFFFSFLIVFNCYQTIFPVKSEFAFKKYGSKFQVNTFAPNWQGESSIATIGEHKQKFVITWQSDEEDGSRFGIFAQMFNSTNGCKIGIEFQVNTYTSYNQAYPSISSIGKNREKFVIAWASDQQDGSLFGIFAQMFNSTNGCKIDPYWDVAAQIFDSANLSKVGKEFQVNELTSSSKVLSSISSIGKYNERFVITWNRDSKPNGNGYDIFAKIFESSNGSKVGKEFQVNTYSPSVQRNPSIASVGKNKTRFVITWAINTNTKLSQVDPSISSIGLNNENFLITWHSYSLRSGIGSGIYAQLFDSANSNKIRKEFHVNKRKKDSPGRPSISSIATNDEEKFVISWTSKDQSRYGIYAQIFYKVNCNFNSCSESDSDSDSDDEDGGEFYVINSSFNLSNYKQGLLSLIFFFIFIIY